MPIRTPDGYLDITNATLRASEINTTSNVGIANSAPTHTLSVGNKLFVDDSAANVLTVSGNLVASTLKLGHIDLTPSYGLEHVANVMNTVSNVVQFTNTGTGFVSASNVGIGTTTTPAGLLDVVGAFRMRYQDMGLTKADIITGANSTNLTESGGVYTYVRSTASTTGNFLPNPSNIIPKVGQRYRVKITARSDYAGTIRYECPTLTTITTYDLTTDFKEYTWDFTATGTTMQFAVTTATGTTSQFNAFSIERLGVGFNVNPTSTNAPVQISGVTHFSDWVGIGTNTPIGTLDVRGAIIAPVIPFSSNQDAPYLVAGTPAYDGDPGNTGNWNLHGFEHRIKVNGSGVPRITVDDGNGNEVFTVVNGGKVGINTASPLQPLNVKGNGENPVIYMTDGTNNRYASGMGTHNVTNVGQRLDFYNGDSGANDTSLGSTNIRMSIDANGNVGIGTTNPLSTLQVGDGSGSSTGDAPGSLSLYGTGATKSNGDRPGLYHRALVGLGVWSDAHISFEVNGYNGGQLEAMRVNTSGYLGIGTASPVAYLDVYNPSHSTQYRETTQFRMSNAADQSGWTRLIFGQTSTNNGFIEASNQGNVKGNLNLQPYGGYVGIGTVNPGRALDIFTGNGSVPGLRLRRYTSGATYTDLRTADSPEGLAIHASDGNVTNIEVMRICGGSGGRVGIGTHDPKSALHVTAPMTYNNQNTVGVEMGVHINSYAGIELTSLSGHPSWVDFKTTTTNADFSERILGGGGHMELCTNAVERMRITSIGQVGIGTQSPAGTFDIQGTTAFDATTMLRVRNPASQYGRNQIIMVGRYEANNDAWSSTGARNGIIFKYQTSSSSSETYAWTMQSFPNGASNDFGFLSGQTSTPKMMLRGSNGHVGIGTDNPDQKLEVWGNIQASTHGNEAFFFESRGTIRMNWYSGGAWLGSGLHFTSAAIWPTDLNGSYSNNGIAFGNSSYRWSTIYSWNALNTASDDRLKHNEAEVVDALGTINKLKLLKYDKTSQMLDADYTGDLTDIPHIKEVGFIAQDVLEIPELSFLVSVPGDPEEEIKPGVKRGEGTYGLDYQGINNILVQAVQELSTKNDTLETKTTALETKLQEAETKITTLQAEKDALRSDISSLALRVTALES